MSPTFSFAFLWALLLHFQQPTVVVSFSTPSPQSSPPPPSKYQFRSFEFEPFTGICRKPASFRYTEEKSSYSSIKVDDDDDDNDTTTQFFVMRNTPGDGDCVFHAVLSSVLISAGILHPDSALFSNTMLTTMALEMRNTVAMYLSSPEGTLYVNNKPRKRIVRARDLLQSAARSEGLTKEDYLKRLRLPGKEGGQYGGGPELTVLSNILRRPISIYHLKEQQQQQQQQATKTTAEDNATVENNYCEIELMGVFGEGIFEDPGQAIPDSVVSNAVFFTMGKSRQQQQTQQSSASSWSPISSPVKCEWHLHILIADTSETEKHATVLLPSVPILHNNR